VRCFETAEMGGGGIRVVTKALGECRLREKDEEMVDV
jgi:hypothetical protein